MQLCKSQVQAFVALGGNLGNPLNTFAEVIAALPHFGVAVEAVSSAYRTVPLLAHGKGEQNPVPDYWNAVCEVRTGLQANALLEVLLGFEQRAGRHRGERWASRTLDLDLLSYGQCIIAEPGLSLPHPRLAQRAFVLQPWCEIAPFALVPGHNCRAIDLLGRLNDPFEGVLEIRGGFAHGLAAPKVARAGEPSVAATPPAPP